MTPIFCTLAHVQYNLFSAYKSYGSSLAVANEDKKTKIYYRL